MKEVAQYSKGITVYLSLVLTYTLTRGLESALIEIVCLRQCSILTQVVEQYSQEITES